MRLVVEHEKVARRRVLLARVVVEHLLMAHLEEGLAEDLVHGDERGRHASRALEEAPAGDAELLRGVIGELLDALFDLLLLPRLRERHVLAVRDHPRRHRPLEGLAFGRRNLLELLVAQPGIFLARSRNPFDHGFLPCLPSSARGPLSIGPPSSFISLAPCISHARFVSPSGCRKRAASRRRGTATTLRPQPEAEFQEFASPRGRATHHCRLARRALAGAAVRYDNELVE